MTALAVSGSGYIVLNYNETRLSFASFFNMRRYTEVRASESASSGSTANAADNAAEAKRKLEAAKTAYGEIKKEYDASTALIKTLTGAEGFANKASDAAAKVGTVASTSLIPSNPIFRLDTPAASLHLLGLRPLSVCPPSATAAVTPSTCPLHTN
jgi:hypothetical protein